MRNAQLCLPLLLILSNCSGDEADSVTTAMHPPPTSNDVSTAPDDPDVPGDPADAGNATPVDPPGAADLSSPQPALMPSTCEGQVLNFAYTSPDECMSSSFRCPPGHGAFINDCGCGCNDDPFAETFSPVEEAATPRDLGCGGVVGELLLFDEPFDELVVGTEAVYLRTGERWWSADKATALLTPHPIGTAPAVSPVQPASPPDAMQATLLESVRLDEELEAIVIDQELYAVSDRGRLWFAALSSSEQQPRILEQRGAYDDDDYVGHIAVDADAVYWQAGVGVVQRTTDGDPLALYRTCRVRPEEK